MKKWLLLSLIFLTAAPLWAGADFEAGNRAYDEGRYLEARHHYEAAVSRGEYSANLFYNLGNANHRLGASGLAMLAYERALALQPGHADAAANLKFLRQQTLAKVPAATWENTIVGALSFDGWVRLTAVLAWGVVLLVCVHVALRRTMGAGTIFTVVLTVSVLGISAWGIWRSSGELDSAVIISKQTEARQGASDRSTLADVLPGGSRVRVINVRGEWTYCVLPSGGNGWVPTTAVERIRIKS